MRRRATNHPSRQSSPAAASRARPDQSSLGSLVRTAGTGTNGEHDPRVTGDGSPPFVPMPLPPCAHHRRGMGCGGGRPITHRTNRPPPPHPMPSPTNRHWAIWSARRARERTANMIRAPLATTRKFGVFAAENAAASVPRRAFLRFRPGDQALIIVFTDGELQYPAGHSSDFDTAAAISLLLHRFPCFSTPQGIPQISTCGGDLLRDGSTAVDRASVPRRAFLRFRPYGNRPSTGRETCRLQYPAGHSSDFDLTLPTFRTAR